MRSLSILASCAAAFLAFSAPSAVHAVITDVARYHLGEAGSLNGASQPLDSLSTDVFPNTFVNTGTVTASSGAPGSTAALKFGPGQSGYYGVSGNGVFGASSLGATPDNFGIELFVKGNPAQGDNVFFTATGTTLAGSGGLVFEVRNGNYNVAVPGIDYIGAVNGVGQPVSADWISLAVIRSNGTDTLYLNGVAQPRTSTVQPTFDFNAHLAVTPGGGTWFDGSMDELHIFTFNPNTDNPASFLTAVPEPSTAMVAAFGALGLLARRRKGC